MRYFILHSLVYVYYEQYLTIAHDAGVNLGLCAGNDTYTVVKHLSVVVYVLS